MVKHDRCGLTSVDEFSFSGQITVLSKSSKALINFQLITHVSNLVPQALLHVQTGSSSISYSCCLVDYCGVFNRCWIINCCVV